jgi:hypothetical protein
MKIPALRIVPALVMAALLSLLAACAEKKPAPPPPPVVDENGPCVGARVLTEPTCPGDTPTLQEQILAAQINAHREDAGLPPIPVSPALTKVANRHVRDLVLNVRRLSNSWSDCAYAEGNLPTYPCMWGAPQRLKTGYPDTAVEIAYSSSDAATAEGAFQQWAGGRQNDLLLSRGQHAGKNWQALGVAIHHEYAVAWFGEAADPANQ